jgi:hypothetical protein
MFHLNFEGFVQLVITHMQVTGIYCSVVYKLRATVKNLEY